MSFLPPSKRRLGVRGALAELPGTGIDEGVKEGSRKVARKISKGRHGECGGFRRLRRCSRKADQTDQPDARWARIERPAISPTPRDGMPIERQRPSIPRVPVYRPCARRNDSRKMAPPPSYPSGGGGRGTPAIPTWDRKTEQTSSLLDWPKASCKKGPAAPANRTQMN